MKNLGTLLLAIWLIAVGLKGAVNLNFQHDNLVFGVLAIVTGVLILLKR